MKKVLVHGYFRMNLGDDLFFRVLALRYPDVLFYIPTIRTDYKQLFKDVKNIKVIDFLKVSKLTDKKVYVLPKLYSKFMMQKFDAVVCIGGSLFIDKKNPTTKNKLETEQYSFICDWEYAKQKNVPYYVLGANWGPCYNSYFREYFDKAFDNLTDLYFRDTASYMEFCDKKATRKGGDILMGNPLIKQFVCNEGSKHQIAISVICPEMKNERDADAEKYYKKVAEICDTYIDCGYQIKLISFCKDEGDEKACDIVLNKSEKKGEIEIVRYDGNWSEILNLMGQSKVIVASRFHATVIGWTLGIPVYSLVYSNKTINLIEDCGLDKGYTRIEDMENLDSKLIKENAVLLDTVDLFSGAESAFEEIDKLLK